MKNKKFQKEVIERLEHLKNVDRIKRAYKSYPPKEISVDEVNKKPFTIKINHDLDEPIVISLYGRDREEVGNILQKIITSPYTWMIL